MPRLNTVAIVVMKKTCVCQNKEIYFSIKNIYFLLKHYVYGYLRDGAYYLSKKNTSSGFGQRHHDKIVRKNILNFLQQLYVAYSGDEEKAL